MKKTIYFLIFTFTVVCHLAACKKDNDAAKALTGLEGTWTGTIKGPSANSPVYNSSFIITPGNKVEQIFENTPDGKGSYTLINNTFTAIIHSENEDVDYIYKSTYEVQTKKFTNGTVGYSPSSDNAGTWSMTKQ